ncbi:DUF423 domain-containing protein [Desertivirga xinjiangensis]|uniref:DUF423 domain-containing protein n=1 Tax=Desertivirga xinjiangensis TaxID=539206 RepID=UPI002109D970|nr:DUF423 domain-containing protein [Pedobacter xinjiangensis]
MDRKVAVTACIFGVLAVISGAFGAHGLKAVLDETQLEQWKTAVSYQFYHTFALLFLSLFHVKSKLLNTAYWGFTLGIILFSGSIYLLSTRNITGFDWVFLGPVTPVGGLFFIIGWMCLLTAAIKSK